jgi:hypothetical protein
MASDSTDRFLRRGAARFASFTPRPLKIALVPPAELDRCRRVLLSAASHRQPNAFCNGRLASPVNGPPASAILFPQKKFPRLKPRLNGNSSLVSLETVLKMIVFQTLAGAPRSMKMGTTRSPSAMMPSPATRLNWPSYDALRLPTTLDEWLPSQFCRRYGLPLNRWVNRPAACG